MYVHCPSFLFALDFSVETDDTIKTRPLTLPKARSCLLGEGETLPTG